MAGGQLSQVLGQLRQWIGPRSALDQSDVELLQRFVSRRDESAFEAMVLRHGPLVLGLCRRVLQNAHDAEDAFQATFLVLARKAGAIRKKESLGSWLYGVASRVARKARASCTRRRTWELPAGAVSPNGSASPASEARLVGGLDAVPDQSPGALNPAAQAMGKEIQAVVDEELQRLPGAYREALMRCYLQGQTNEEAARALGWPAGSMSRHLGRARELLRDRLTRRGVGLPTIMLGSLLAENLASATVPTALAKATARAAMTFQAGSAGLAGIVSPQAAEFAQSIVRAMFMTKLKIATVLLLAAGILAAGAGRYWYQPAASAADGANPASKKAADDPAPKAKGKGAPMSDNLRVAALRKKLAESYNMEKPIDPGTPLIDALAYFQEHFEVPIHLDIQAFKDEAAFEGADDALGDVEATPVKLPKMDKMPQGAILRLFLAQVPPNGATYLIRPEGLLVTTLKRSRPEDWTDTYRRGVPVVNTDFEQTPLKKALEDLTVQTGISVVLDGRAADKAKTAVTATLNNVPLDTAVRLLADMADLKAVAIDNVMYVTTPVNARTLQAEQEKRRQQTRGGKQPQDQPKKEQSKGGTGPAK